MDAVRIGIAVVERDGAYLVGYRESGQVLAGHAEFPGGKCQPGESPDVCAVRECREETGLAVTSVRKLDQTRVQYDHGAVELHFWLCHPVDAQDALAGNFRWIPVGQLRDLPFPDGNSRVVDVLTSDGVTGQS